MTPAVTAFIGLGGNQGDSAAILSAAIEVLRGIEQTELVRCSSYYRTAPIGYEQQDDFLNAVCELRTSLSAADLLRMLQQIELDSGRVRDGAHWGPRTLDLDLLLYGDLQQTSSELTLPHPRMHERAFVLYPLLEVAPDLVVPGKGAIVDLVRACAEQEIRRLE